MSQQPELATVSSGAKTNQKASEDTAIAGANVCVSRGHGGPTACDIVDGGVVKPQYAGPDKNGDSSESAVIGEDADVAVVYIRPVTGAMEGVRLVVLSEDKETLEPMITSDFKDSNTLAAGAVGKAQVTFNCQGKGEARVAMVLRSKTPASTTKFSFIKKCGGVQESQDRVKTMGVDVATIEGTQRMPEAPTKKAKRIADANVVSDGKVADDFVLGGEDAYKGLAAVGVNNGFTEFYVGAHQGLGEDVKLGEAVVISEASTCRPVLSGSAIGGATLKVNDPVMDLTVTYNCRTSGETPVTVRIPVLEPIEGTITFSIKKTCQVEAAEIGKERPVKDEISIPGLTVLTGNTYTPATIVRDGITLPEWTETATDDVDTDPLTGVAGDESAITPVSMINSGRKIFTFVVKMDATDDEGSGSQGVDNPIVFVEDPDVVAARIDEDLSSVTTEEQILHVNFRCFKTGSSKVTVSIPLSPPTGDIKFTVVKVCNPPTSISDQNKRDQLQDELGIPKFAIDVSLSSDAKDEPMVVRNGKTQDAFLVRSIATSYAPLVKDMLSEVNKAKGISEGCRTCLPSELTLGANMASVKSKIVSCNVTKACTLKEMYIAENAVKTVVAKSYAKAAGPAVIAAGQFSLNTFLKVYPGSADIQIGNAEVVSFDDKVCQPKLIGPASEAGTLTGTPSKLTTTFNCAGYGGSALVVVTVPVYGKSKSGSISFAVLKQCAHVNATEFGGAESDNAEMANELENVIAHSGIGLNVGTKADTKSSAGYDVIENGLVMPEFLPSSSADNKDAGGYIVNADTEHASFYFSSVDSSVLSEPVSIGVPQVISFNPRICNTNVDETSGLHNSQSVRKKFMVMGPTELGINFKCVSSGIAVIAVAIPLGPRGGGLNFEFAKECKLDADNSRDYTGDVIQGLSVGTSNDLSDVIKDGQTSRLWTRYKKEAGAGGRMTINAATREIDFFIHLESGSDGEAKSMEFGAPIAIAHKPVANPSFEGGAAKGGHVTGNSIKLTVRFNCVWEGSVPITVFVPLPNYKDNGHIVWTFTKRCATQSSDVANDVQVPIDDTLLVDHDNDGIVGPEHDDWMDWNPNLDYLDYYDYDQPYYASSYYDYQPWSSDWTPDEWDDKLGDSYWWYTDAYYYNQDYADFGDNWALDYDYDSGIGTDPVVEAINRRGWDNSIRLSVGTHEGATDVVSDGTPLPRYKICEPTPGQPCTLMAMISQPEAKFYISSPDFETLGQVRAFSKYERSVDVEIGNANSLEGKVVEPGEPVEITVKMECLKQGVTSPVLVTIPFGGGLHHADFSVLRVCGKRYSTAALAIETTTIFIGVGVVVSMVLSFLAGRRLKKSREGRDLSD